MPFNEFLANRIAEKLMDLPDVEEKIMFSGLVFMVNGKMCIGVMKDKIMLRINPESLNSLTDKDGWEHMAMGGKQMNGFILVSEDVINQNKELDYWINLALEFNPLAKASKKKKKINHANNNQILPLNFRFIFSSDRNTQEPQTQK